MKNLKLFIALVAISLGISSCSSSSNEPDLTATTTAYLIRTQTLVENAYTYRYNPFFTLSANKNLVSATCSVNNLSSKMKQFGNSFYSDYVFNTPFAAIEDMTVQFIVKDEDQNTLVVANEISNITDNMGFVNLKKLEYKDGVVYFTYDETENASQYVLTVRDHGTSYRYSHPLSKDGSYTLSNIIDYENGKELDVCLSAINSKGTVVADSPYYMITVGTDFSTED